MSWLDRIMRRGRGERREDSPRPNSANKLLERVDTRSDTNRAVEIDCDQLLDLIDTANVPRASEIGMLVEKAKTLLADRTIDVVELREVRRDLMLHFFVSLEDRLRDKVWQEPHGVEETPEERRVFAQALVKARGSLKVPLEVLVPGFTEAVEKIPDMERIQTLILRIVPDLVVQIPSIEQRRATVRAFWFYAKIQRDVGGIGAEFGGNLKVFEEELREITDKMWHFPPPLQGRRR